MRLPWGEWDRVSRLLSADLRNAILIGCVSFEERATRVPSLLDSLGPGRISLFEIEDPPDGIPTWMAECKRRQAMFKRRATRAASCRIASTLPLRATDDAIITATRDVLDHTRGSDVVFDITSFPKRFFCLMLKRLMADDRVRSLTITYTDSGPRGHAVAALSSNPMPWAALPGFIEEPSDPNAPKTLVISIGFEATGLRNFLVSYRGGRRPTKMILPFPNSPPAVRRQWDALQSLTDGNPTEIRRDDVVQIPPYDAEDVYLRLRHWATDSNGLTLAPYGPKPQTLGMALYAVEHGCGMYYSQPQTYNPLYTSGFGLTWAYIAKYDGIACFAR